MVLAAVDGNSTVKVSWLPETSPPLVVPALTVPPPLAVGTVMPPVGNLYVAAEVSTTVAV